MKARIKMVCYANDRIYKRGEEVDIVECKNITPDYYEIIETATPTKETATVKKSRKSTK